MSLLRSIEFKLLPKEQEAYERWRKRHQHPAHHAVNRFASGGLVTFHFTPTGIGEAVEVECRICREKTNITDYESW